VPRRRADTGCVGCTGVLIHFSHTYRSSMTDGFTCAQPPFYCQTGGCAPPVGSRVAACTRCALAKLPIVPACM
jgi:hypothetical protein